MTYSELYKEMERTITDYSLMGKHNIRESECVKDFLNELEVYKPWMVYNAEDEEDYCQSLAFGGMDEVHYVYIKDGDKVEIDDETFGINDFIEEYTNNIKIVYYSYIKDN